MTPDKVQALANMNTRQKVIAGILILVILIILWVLFGGKKTSVNTPVIGNQTAAIKTSSPGAGMPPGGTMPAQITPKAAEVPQTVPMSDREAQLIQLQQETQAKYLEALNELQILKITRDIANTNKDISTATLARVVSEKKIVDMLAPPPPPPTTQAIIKPISAAPGPGTNLDQNVSYTVVSVSQLQYRWGAVLGYKGSLFNVHVGDVLPPDGSTVTAINKEGVTLEKDSIKKKVSLVPII